MQRVSDRSDMPQLSTILRHMYFEKGGAELVTMYEQSCIDGPDAHEDNGKYPDLTLDLNETRRVLMRWHEAAVRGTEKFVSNIKLLAVSCDAVDEHASLNTGAQISMPAWIARGKEFIRKCTAHSASLQDKNKIKHNANVRRHHACARVL